MASVTVIPANTHIRKEKDEQIPAAIRVAAYCRVSTDSDEQATSYEAQIEHYTSYIGSHPGWTLAGIYADDGISGTNTSKREQFNRMIDDCMNGSIDMVVSKSISRFARNTLDCLTYIRKLKDKGIPVYFEKENINTVEAQGELLLTIMASLAQQESQSLSQNVRLGLKYRYQEGKVQVCTNRFLGYDKDENGTLVINPEEAKVVRRIFREYLDGASYKAIGDGLSADGIRTAAGNLYWRASTLHKILTNEKYMGDALLQKTVTTDYLTKKRVKNKGLVPQYYVEDSHEPIIPRKLFIRVQEEMVRRANLETTTGRRSVYKGKYALSGIVVCDHCREVFQRSQWVLKDGKHAVWRCVNRLRKKEDKCPSRTVFEDDLHAAIVKAVNAFRGQKDDFLGKLRKNVCTVLGGSEELSSIEKELADAQVMLLDAVKSGEESRDLEVKVEELREKRQNVLTREAMKAGAREQMDDIGRFLEAQTTDITEYDDILVRRLIERVIVKDERLTIRFKSGWEFEV